ncbi:MAG: putative solute-binding protein [Ketobacteraceae bacterium]|nr:putative solute-binding protein [Ketobacteraceae bacterium]
MFIRLIIGIVFFLSSLFSISSSADEPVPLKMCAFTLLGESGPDFELVKDYQLAALSWGAELDVKAYISEKVIVNELKSGACDIASMTGGSAHSFNRFSGTIGAIGAIPDYEHLHVALAALNGEKARPYLSANGFDVVGIQPSGGIYLFLNDRYLKGIADLAGRRVGVLDNFPEMHKMVTNMGMTPVSSTVSNMFQKFNNGNIDIVGGPAIVYEVMELYKGLKDTGGVIEAPIMQSTIQVIARSDKLPAGFAEKSRQYFFDQFSESVDILSKAEKTIPRKYWIPVPKCNMEELEKTNKTVRLNFREKGIYHPKMLTLLRKVRCNLDPSRAECTSPDAE